MAKVPRSFLFTPGSRPDRFLKAASCNADAIILDLEDSVAEDAKAIARENVVRFLESTPDLHLNVVVRINQLDRVAGLEDLAALARLNKGPDFLLIPKAEEPAEIATIARVLASTGSSTRLGGLVESAKGIAQAAELAVASSRLDFLMFGAADYAADLGQQVDVYCSDHARAVLVNAAAAGGIVAVDSPFFAIDRPDELLAACGRGRSLGFHGMAAIHPAQVAIITDTYMPSATERLQAQRVVEAASGGVGVLDGKMVDIAMVRWARRII